MESKTLTFEQEKETNIQGTVLRVEGDDVLIDIGYKSAVRFQEQVADGQQAVIGPLYIQKHALGSEPPKTVTLTIS
jgi:ribosomal protein S1